MADYALDMLAPKAQYSVGDAKRYFKEHLSAGDYYAEGQRVPGEWFGNGAENLGLSGVTNENDFVRLCENLHPQTGVRLTLRQKTTRTEIETDGQESQSANRRVFYDFTFSPPKSVSIAALVRDDSRILKAHEQAVTAALNQLQLFAATRVRKHDQCSDRTTGNLVAAVFRHDTSRALDPHLHSHCIVFNATFDAVEGQWKALQNHDMLVAQKFIANVYYHELARELRQSGYAIENKPRGDFEINGISRELIDKFSKRHREIDEKTRELLVREPEKADGNITEVEAGRGIALSSPFFKLVTGKRLLYRPLTGTTESLSVGIAHATKGDVTPAGEKFCEILRNRSGEATTAKPKAVRFV